MDDHDMKIFLNLKMINLFLSFDCSIAEVGRHDYCTVGKVGRHDYGWLTSPFSFEKEES